MLHFITYALLCSPCQGTLNVPGQRTSVEGTNPRIRQLFRYLNRTFAVSIGKDGDSTEIYSSFIRQMHNVSVDLSVVSLLFSRVLVDSFLCLSMFVQNSPPLSECQADAFYSVTRNIIHEICNRHVYFIKNSMHHGLAHTCPCLSLLAVVFACFVEKCKMYDMTYQRCCRLLKVLSTIFFSLVMDLRY